MKTILLTDTRITDKGDNISDKRYNSMKKIILRSICFLGMLMLVTGSVVISCATAPGMHKDTSVSLNTGKNTKGEIYTTWLFSDIQKVIITNSSDRSRKTELSPGDWKYNETTTELILLSDISFSDYIITVEGNINFPNTFILNNIDKDNDILVILDNRLGIDRYDYYFDKAEKSLVFRNDLNLKKVDWYISYSTSDGGASIGDWKPENQDQMAYFEAEHRKKYLDSWYDSQEAFWFLESGNSSDEQDKKPVLVRRAAAPEELNKMKSSPVSIFKYRGMTKNTKLEKELGFDIYLPEIIHTENPTKVFKIFTKTIEEYYSSGVLSRKLHISYKDEASELSNPSMINVILSPVSANPEVYEKPDWIIMEKYIDLGKTVKKTDQWAMQIYGVDKKTEIVQLSSWNWNDESARFLVESESSEENISESFIRKIISARAKKNN